MDPVDLPLYYVDGPHAGKKYVDPNTPTGQRWRDGRGGCYEVTGDIRPLPEHGLVRIVRHVWCGGPPPGTVEQLKPNSNAQNRAFYLGVESDEWFTAYEDSARYEYEKHPDRAQAESFLAVLVQQYGRDTSWSRHNLA